MVDTYGPFEEDNQYSECFDAASRIIRRRNPDLKFSAQRRTMDKINDQVHDLNLSDNFSDRFNRLDLSPSGGPCVL